MKRELLFDVEPWAHVPPRVWHSVHDIPRGTLVRAAGREALLYVTTSGRGWWMLASTDIPYAERHGWDLVSAPRGPGDGPFTEVVRP